MTDALLNYIQAHEHDDLPSLLLKQKEILGHPATFVVNLINGRRKAKERLPSWYANPAIVYPPQQNLEQCSSEATAKLKCEIIRQSNTTGTMADLTGGFGVDSFFFSRIFNTVYHVEPDHVLCRLAKESHEQLDATNIKYLQSTAEEFLSQTTQKPDWVYLDPSRKSKGKKVFRLSDSQPDVTGLLENIFSVTKNILIKTSPLLDVKEGIRQLPGTKDVYVVSIGNECKEILFRLQKDWTTEPEIHCIDLTENKQKYFRFRFSEEVNTISLFSEPLGYIYEPNVSILKAGAFKTIAGTYSLLKISANTHLYTSEHYENEFPGRIFKTIIPLGINRRSPEAGEGHFNIISRNHPLSVDEIKKKFRLKDGGEKYVLAFSGKQKKYMIVAERLK